MKYNTKEISSSTTIDTNSGRILAHMDIIGSLHHAIPDTSENRKKLEGYICSTCCEIACTGKGRCRAIDITFVQLNLLTALVTIRDEGSPELGIEGFNRVIPIGEALTPFNIALADYLKEEDNQILHAMICFAKSKNPDITLGKLVIPKGYNIKVNKLI